MFGFEGAQLVMAVVAVIAFLTVVAVIYVGSQEDNDHPQTADQSNAVNAWNARKGKAEDLEQSISES